MNTLGLFKVPIGQIARREERCMYIRAMRILWVATNVNLPFEVTRGFRFMFKVRINGLDRFKRRLIRRFSTKEAQGSCVIFIWDWDLAPTFFAIFGFRYLRNITLLRRAFFYNLCRTNNLPI